DLKYFSFCLFLLCSDRVEGNTALMCLASGMYPPPVQISWKRQKGSKEEPAPAEEKQQEISGSRSSAIIRLVKNETLYNYDYICEVQHEGGKVTNQTRFKGTKSRSSGEMQLSSNISLLCLLYSVLIVKSLVYCCGLSLLMVLRTKGPAPS
uniref:Ig-like domain-containing protein n=1 Tax=Poecilia mexicana TaxID=48701 RepID=A0A3B3WNC5_9TELE